MLEWATSYFREKGVKSPRLSIEWLLSDVLGLKRLDLYLNHDRPLAREERDRLRPLVVRRAADEPLQYITGYTDFHHLRIRVSPDVLIPRPETEQLVELVLEECDSKPRSVLDIGTGSGCIALALKKARPEWTLHALDRCGKALGVARSNARENGLEVIFHHGPFQTFQPGEKPDIIVSNPPYITPEEKESLDHEVAAYEPGAALFTDNISQLYDQLFLFCRDYGAPGGSCYFEINESFGDALLKTARHHSLTLSLEKDYSGKDRFLKGKF